jgi:GalNAc-alpha-(1->4)-GalNAc-alpha-(1->3)-diNAcBac-PP-undecaprenol alpha-1,4-N-acetyl-D-galactosaminyltransferase
MNMSNGNEHARRILLIINSLTGGGAEHVAVLLAEGFARRGHDVSLLTSRAQDEDAYPLPNNVRRCFPMSPRRTSSKIDKNVSLLRSIRHAADETMADVVISFMSVMNLRAILALSGTGVPLIVTEHSELDAPTKSRSARYLMRLLYPSASYVVCVSSGVAQGFSWVPRDRLKVIYNPIALPDAKELVESPSDILATDVPYIIGMGRLEREKGFDRLVDAFALIADRFPEWHLVILGEGSLRKELEGRVKAKNLVSRVHLPGFLREPYKVLSNGTIFVLSSRRESFGMALVEAMACGLPVIAFDDLSGPSEIVSPGEDGVLVRPAQVGPLAEAMADLIQDPEKRRSLAERAVMTAKTLDIDHIVDAWEQLFVTLPRSAPTARRRTLRFNSGKCWYTYTSIARSDYLKARVVALVRAYTRHLSLPFKYKLARSLIPPEKLPSIGFACEFFGLRYHGELSNHIDWHVFLFGAYAWEELELLRSIAIQICAISASRPVFCDVGANVGNHALYLSRYCKNVHCFEPYPKVFARLQAQIQRNGLQNINLHPVALGNSDGMVRFFEPPDSNLGMGSICVPPPGGSGSVSVPVVRGDDCFASFGIERCHVLKIDVEGAEVDVLRGLRATIQRDRPVILMELSQATKAQLGNLDGLLSLLYGQPEVWAVAKGRTQRYRLRAVNFDSAGEILIIPPSYRGLLDL